MKATFNNAYTALQTSLIDRLAEIEQSDADACAGCGGEDCMCCEVYHDRQRWVEPDELFANDELGDMYHSSNDFICDKCEHECDEYCTVCNCCPDCCTCE